LAAATSAAASAAASAASGRSRRRRRRRLRRGRWRDEGGGGAGGAHRARGRARAACGAWGGGGHGWPRGRRDGRRGRRRRRWRRRWRWGARRRRGRAQRGRQGRPGGWAWRLRRRQIGACTPGFEYRRVRGGGGLRRPPCAPGACALDPPCERRTAGAHLRAPCEVQGLRRVLGWAQRDGRGCMWGSGKWRAAEGARAAGRPPYRIRRPGKPSRSASVHFPRCSS